MNLSINNLNTINLPDLNCGICGHRTCDEFKEALKKKPEMIERCIHLSKNNASDFEIMDSLKQKPRSESLNSCGECGLSSQPIASEALQRRQLTDQPTAKWKDSLGRDFDFYLEHFPEDPGPREIILPHNPMITREMDIQVGDIMIGRPLGMSCGCPITHCGVAMEVDHRTGVISWCVTGPLEPRQKGYKDLGYYIAEGYEGLISEARCDIKIGMRYYFQPHMCMLQWRHSGLVNLLNRTSAGLQVRLEGLWIG